MTCAAWRDRVECVNILLLTGADVNLSPPSENPPIQHVARRGYVNCMKMPLDAGADVNQMTS